MKRTLYEVLGVVESATPAEIKAAFRARAKATHPDHNPGSRAAEAEFKEVKRAYEVLADAARHGDYNRALWLERQRAAAAKPTVPQPSYGGLSVGDIIGTVIGAVVLGGLAHSLWESETHGASRWDPNVRRHRGADGRFV